jgi:hypothetical protein
VKLSRFALGLAVAIALIGGSLMAAPVGAQDDCVAIYGGDVMNSTVIDLNANGGTAISDASGGSGNTAETGGHRDGDGDSHVDIASAGNGGVATASANGGAISTGDINSGGNVGNAISVGDTQCAAVDAAAPDAPKADKGDRGGGKVTALPDTGVGVGEVNGVLALLASAGAAAASLGLRRR